MIVTKLSGGMGNQMFQYSVGRALAIKHNTSLHLYLDNLLDRDPKLKHTFRDYDLDIFNTEESFIGREALPIFYRHYFNSKSRFFMRGLRFVIRKFIGGKWVGRHLDFGPVPLSNEGEDLYLEGFWFNEKYFSDIIDILRKDFTLKKAPDMNIKNLIEVIKKENSLCIHVRRGDYVGNKDFENVTNDYYYKALAYLDTKVKIDRIYVFSDDIAWCKENMNFDTPAMFVGSEYSGEKAGGHHTLMQSCKYFIIPNSTFSWWAAWLAPYKDKIVIAPKSWHPESSKHKDNDKDSIVPVSWIKI